MMLIPIERRVNVHVRVEIVWNGYPNIPLALFRIHDPLPSQLVMLSGSGYQYRKVRDLRLRHLAYVPGFLLKRGSRAIYRGIWYRFVSAHRRVRLWRARRDQEA